MAFEERDNQGAGDRPEASRGADDTDRDPVEVLGAEFMERKRRGECPTVAEYEARYPEHAEAIRELFPTIEAMERLKVRKERSSDGRATLGGVQLERLGDFRILREIGRGGMGIVYEAEQESLGRHVAVKVLPRQSLLDPRQLERFQREAQTAARLHHTNIVPIFGVGQQDGYHYYVMQYIRGVGLDSVLETLTRPETGGPESAARRLVDRTTPVPGRQSDSARDSAGSDTRGETPGGSRAADSDAAGPARDREAQGIAEASRPAAEGSLTQGHDDAGKAPQRPDRSYWMGVARIGLQAAEALAYAHAQGTLHRDIKPANLLLDSHGVTWITDFGLAKAMEHDPLSQTGDVVGTLRYMAPERFSGRVDARSDIYGLGLTLYELLVFRPAYQGTDRSRLIRSITQTEPVRPRKLQPGIPRDLETIVLKAIARDPAHRYASAGDLAADLNRFLEDRPIHAKRTTTIERMWRWSRRNPATASLATTALTLLILLAVVTTAGYFKMKSAMEGELRERKRAVATSDLALEALDKIFERFAPSRSVPLSDLTVEDEEGEEIEVPVQPVLSKEAALLLEQLLVVYRGLAEQEGAGSTVPRKVAEANRRVGDIHQRLGQREKAEAAYLRALEGFEAIEEPDDLEGTSLVVEIARVHNELGNVLQATQRSGRPSYLKARDLLASHTTPASQLPEHRFELARTYYLLARRPGLSPVVEPSGPPRASGFPQAQKGRGGRGPMSGRGPGLWDAGEGRRRGGLRGGGPRGDPASFQRGPRGGFPGFWRPDRESLRPALELLEPLVEEFPFVPEYRHLLARCYREMAPRRRGGADSTLDPVSRATEILSKLVEDFPDVADYRYDLSEAYARLDPRQLRGRIEDGGEVEKRLREALRISQDIIAEHPNVPDYATSQVRILLKLAELLRQRQDRDGAEAQLRRALDLQSSLALRFPTVSSYRVWTAAVQDSLARVLEEKSQWGEARTLLESSVEQLGSLLGSARQEPHIRWMYVGISRRLVMLLRQRGETEAADELQRKIRTAVPSFGERRSR